MTRKLTAGLLILLYMFATVGMAVHKCHCNHSETLVLFNSEKCICDHPDSPSACEDGPNCLSHRDGNGCNTEFKKVKIEAENTFSGESFLPFVAVLDIVDFSLPESFFLNEKSSYDYSPIVCYEKSGIYFHCQLRL